MKPPRRKSAEKEIVVNASPTKSQLQLLDLENEASSPILGGTIPTSPGHSNSSKPLISRQMSSDSQASAATARSKSFSGSRDSLFGSGSDFKNVGISKNFSSEIIRELYGSKTSLLKTLELENARRRQSIPLTEREEPEGAAAPPGPPEGALGTLEEGPDSGLYDLPDEERQEPLGFIPDHSRGSEPGSQDVYVNQGRIIRYISYICTLQNMLVIFTLMKCMLIKKTFQRPFKRLFKRLAKRLAKTAFSEFINTTV